MKVAFTDDECGSSIIKEISMSHFTRLVGIKPKHVDLTKLVHGIM